MTGLAEAGLPRLLYIMGTARSGTTILEILAGNSDGVTNVGELTHIFTDGFLRDVECACGSRASQCRVWGAVRRLGGWSEADVRRLAVVTRSMDRHWGFLAAFLGLQRGGRWEAYRAGQLGLLNVIARVTGAPILVDSSVYAARALALRRLMGASLRVVCVSRDPAGLLLSFRKGNKDEQLPKTRLQLLAYYIPVLMALRLASWRLGSIVLQVRFEDLQADPDATLARIGAWAGIDLTTARRLVREVRPLTVGHIVTGNRLRKERPLLFRRERERVTAGWRDGLTVGLMRVWRRLLGFA